MEETFPINTFGLSETSKINLLKSYALLLEKFSAEEAGTFQPDFSVFDCTKHYLDFFSDNFFFISKSKACIGFVLVTYSNGAGRYNPSLDQEMQCWGYLETKQDYGHLLIRPENLTDKLIELINPAEVDFDDDPFFSKKFYVLSEDPFKTQMMLNSKFRELVKKIPKRDFIIEIRGKQLVITNQKVINPEDVGNFADFLSSLSAEML